MIKLFPEYDEQGKIFRPLIEKTAQKICTLKLKEDWDRYLSDIPSCKPTEFIGEISQLNNITKTVFFDFTKIVPVSDLSNGLLLELYNFSIKEKTTITYLHSVIDILKPGLFKNSQELRQKCIGLKAKVQNLKKTKSKCSELQTLLNAFIVKKPDKINDEAANFDKILSSKEREIRKLDSQLTEIKENQHSVLLKLSTAQELCRKKEKDILDQKVQISKLQKIIENLSKRDETKSQQIHELTLKNNDIRCVLAQIKSGATYN